MNIPLHRNSPSLKLMEGGSLVGMVTSDAPSDHDKTSWQRVLGHLSQYWLLEQGNVECQ